MELSVVELVRVNVEFVQVVFTLEYFSSWPLISVWLNNNENVPELLWEKWLPSFSNVAFIEVEVFSVMIAVKIAGVCGEIVEVVVATKVSVEFLINFPLSMDWFFEFFSLGVKGKSTSIHGNKCSEVVALLGGIFVMSVVVIMEVKVVFGVDVRVVGRSLELEELTGVCWAAASSSCGSLFLQ